MEAVTIPAFSAFGLVSRCVTEGGRMRTVVVRPVRFDGH